MWTWRMLLRVPWTDKCFNLNEINRSRSLEFQIYPNFGKTLKERMGNHEYALKWVKIENSALVK
ncbi:hypothetical protein LAZ67_16000886 [Cordylochernes scorpioides]|uniref:Ycf15 n=1 Tax=Cordylochernes scorpioides TaxID=51811 RepID=A0ABY6LAX4_9ARAC|nr:hypothetical protein LAZ67_16000886 [Cordylochernes scorpioides]